MIIDIHVHEGKSLFGYEFDIQKLLDNMQKIGIDRAVLHPLKPYNYHFEPENTRISEIVKKYPDKFQAFGRIDPWRKDNALAEIKRIFEDLNFMGIFLHPMEEQFSLTSPVLKPVLSLLKEYKKPVMVSGGHVRVSHPRQIEYLAGEYPDITFIATSGGQINISGMMLTEAEAMLTNRPNVYMETSGIYRRDFIERMTIKLGAERILFGSGVPYYDQAFELERIKTADITNEEKGSILGRNTARMLTPLNIAVK
ncbi:MAG: amidohydrolase family protein [Candidatus Eremiobacteraeota bacterium]|nr:amidohydrolase family protein [Candidatus Eremiobacteraeota bacterium]